LSNVVDVIFGKAAIASSTNKTINSNINYKLCHLVRHSQNVKFRIEFLRTVYSQFSTLHYLHIL
jgi:hypothetical protein